MGPGGVGKDKAWMQRHVTSECRRRMDAEQRKRFARAPVLSSSSMLSYLGDMMSLTINANPSTWDDLHY